MKYILPLILLFASLTAAQSLPSDDQFIKNFKRIGTSGEKQFFVNDIDVKRAGNQVEFFGFLFEDETNNSLTRFSADCLRWRWIPSEMWGKRGGRFVHGVSTKEHPAPAGSAITKALTIVCGAML